MKRKLRGLYGFFFVLGIFGCGTKDIAHNGPGYRCVEETQVVSDLQSVQPLGFSAQQIFDFAIGSHETPLHWRSHLEDWNLNFGPESGQSSMTVDLNYTGAPIHWIHSRVEKTDDGRSAPPKSACPDRLEVPVVAIIQSAQGALNETIETTISATGPQLATLKHQFTLDDLDGSLHVANKGSEGLKVKSIDFSVGISPFGISGNLQIDLTRKSEQWIEEGMAWLATFPRAEEHCPFGSIEAPFDQPIGAFSGADVIQRLADTSPLHFRWTPYSQSFPVHLELGEVEGITKEHIPVCFPAISNQDDQDLDTVQFRAPLRLSSEDGNLDVTFLTNIRAQRFSDGSLGVIELEIDRANTPGLPRQQFLETYTIEGIDVSQYPQAGIDVYGVVGPKSTSGTFSVFGQIRHECRESTKPGCAEIERTNVAQATWGSSLP